MWWAQFAPPPPQVEIGLTDLQKSGSAMAPPAHRPEYDNFDTKRENTIKICQFWPMF